MMDNNKQFDEIEWKNTLKKVGEDARDSEFQGHLT